MSVSREDRFARTLTRRKALGLFAVGTTGLIAACAQAPAAAPVAQSAAAASAAPVKPPRWGMTAAQESAWQQVEAAAVKEARLTYYSLGTVPTTQVDRLKTEFAKDYPEIKIDYLNVGNSNNMTARLTTEQDGKVYVADVYDQSVRAALLLPPEITDSFIPPTVTDPSVKWLYNPVADPEKKGRILADVAQFFAIWTNTKLVSSADAPKNMMDVATNPKWKGQIIFRTPWSSGGGSHLYHFAKQVYGESWVTKMQAQNPTFADDQDQALIQVSRGEFAIGIGLTGRQGSQFITAGQPLAAIWPDDFVITITQGTNLVARAPHPNAAKVFMNWMHTERGQLFWRDLGQWPIRSDILPTAPWMQGVSKAKQVFENLMNAKDQQAEFDAAAKAFKK